MDYNDAKRQHEILALVGLRAHATAVGFLQLCHELVDAGVIDDAAVSRIKDAITADLSLSRPGRMTPQEFDASTRRRLDALFSGEEKVSARKAGDSPDDATPT